MAAFTLFNNLADFVGRVNNVVGWFDNIDSFMGSGGTQSESQINVEQINELKTRLADLATDVESKFEHRMFMFTMYNGFASLREKLEEMKEKIAKAVVRRKKAEKKADALEKDIVEKEKQIAVVKKRNAELTQTTNELRGSRV